MTWASRQFYFEDGRLRIVSAFEVPEGFEWSDAGPFLRPIPEPDPEDEEATN